MNKHFYTSESLKYLAQGLSCCLGAVGTWWGVAAQLAGSGDVPIALIVCAATLTILTIGNLIAAVDNKVAAEREQYWEERSSTKKTRI